MGRGEQQQRQQHAGTSLAPHSAVRCVSPAAGATSNPVSKDICLDCKQATLCMLHTQQLSSNVTCASLLSAILHTQGTITAAKQALSQVDRSAVKGVAVSGQQHGMVALGADGSVLRPAKLWCDTETAPEAAELSQKLGYTVVSSSSRKL
jgi:hypothetical protein